MPELSSAPSVEGALPGRKRVLYVASAAMALAYLPWYNYSAVLPLVRREFALSSSDAGIILGSFQLGYVVFVLFTGWLSDKVGPCAILAGSALLTGVASLGFGLFAGDLASALFWRLLVGAGCGGLYVPGMALLAEWFPPRQRGLALGTYTAAVTLGYAGAYLIASPLASATDWRTAVVVTSLGCFVAAYLYGWQIRSAPRQAERVVIGDPVRVNWRSFLRGRAGLAAGILTLAYCGHMWEAYGFLGWVGPFFVASSIQNGVSPTQAVATGGTLAAAAVMVGTLGPWAGGMLADRVGRGASIIALMSISVPLSFLFGWLVGSPLPLVFPLGVVYGLAVVSDAGIYKAGLTELVPAEMRATAMSVQSAIGFGVSIISPAVFGLVLDASNPPELASPLTWGWAYVAMGVGGLVGPLAMLALRRMPESRAMGGGKG
jgi:MFS family permease